MGTEKCLYHCPNSTISFIFCLFCFNFKATPKQLVEKRIIRLNWLNKCSMLENYFSVFCFIDEIISEMLKEEPVSFLGVTSSDLGSKSFTVERRCLRDSTISEYFCYFHIYSSIISLILIKIVSLSSCIPNKRNY